MAYDASDFGRNTPEESAANFANILSASAGENKTYTAKDFMDDERKDSLDKKGADGRSPVTTKRPSGIMSVFQKMIGYKPNLALSTNLYNMLVPGQNTPLGGLTFLAGPALGLDKAAQFGLSLANRGIAELPNPFPAKTQEQIDATPVYDLGTQPPGPPTNMGIMNTYQAGAIPSISMQKLPQLYSDNFYE